MTMQNLPSCNHYVVFFFIQAIFAMIAFSYYKTPKYCSHTSNPDYQTLSPDASKEHPLVILLWTWPFGSRFPLNKCKKPSEQGCWFTDDREKYSTANAVIFHHRDVCGSRSQLPQIPRPPGQYWVWFNLESPSHSPNLGMMDNLMNLTMSYRADSDIFTPYGYLLPDKSNQNFTIPEKSKLVAWAVSNWNPGSRRVQFYEQIKKYIKIDVFGRQHESLPNEKLSETISQYKFYFSFENSIHRDYITEKLWRNAMFFRSVPIVLGPPRENYERFIPRDAFIHVDDFTNASQMADYLLQLDKDNEKYQQYFNWRSRYKPKHDNQWSDNYCAACNVLKEAPAFRTITSLGKWFT
ncbi:3-galactosyl-N-acetylglucosaminide 4-alpha-L-fucosyltransferase FUT3 [Xenopus laevis]|uniref:Fucosyltransferase n=2 Tax=Xenopus laevis TaxID=8355 RepID=A0A1L8GJ77_XENLA|nr:3-galactosyl-N-acetylglucosaminide 4-alpha-L-fucosyltransferase FUT3 [Xenopus laevis]XP_041445506.1 3-galactosyl-N-acetylglucosaminide 4-alpha-L-fucosyltransferase FUT3 [Xenopus laevis]OCT83904.1 hypothetical protein XELAEV_18022043mg [Xenopus laevis]